MDLAELKAEIELAVPIGSLIGTRATRLQCPFHNSSDLDLAVKHHTNMWRCYGACDDGHWHSIFDWVMLSMGCEFKEALRILAEQAGIPLGANRERSRILKESLSYFKECLFSDREALDYLKRRGFGEYHLFQRQIGYAGSMGIPPDVSTTELEMVGLVRRTHLGVRPYFRNRIVYPIFDRKVELVQMQGRLYPEPNYLPNESKLPKYLGLSNEVDLKGRTIFDCLAGEDDLVRQAHRGFAFLTEGWPDAETLRAWGLPVGGLFGHSGLERHAFKLGHLQEVFVVLDPDKASQGNIYPALYRLALKIPHVIFKNIYLDTSGLDINDWAMQSKPTGELLDPYKDEHKIAQLRVMVTHAKPLVQDLIERWWDRPHLVQPLLLLIAKTQNNEKWIWELAQRMGESERAVKLLLRVLSQDSHI